MYNVIIKYLTFLAFYQKSAQKKSFKHGSGHCSQFQVMALMRSAEIKYYIKWWNTSKHSRQEVKKSITVPTQNHQ